MITSDRFSSLKNRIKSTKPVRTNEQRTRPEIDKWLGHITKWIHVLEKWELEGKLLRQLHQLSTMGKDKKEADIHLSNELNSILKDEIRPLKFNIYDLTNETSQMELFPSEFRKKMEILKIRLHRIGEKYDDTKLKVLLNIVEYYPISII